MPSCGSFENAPGLFQSLHRSGCVKHKVSENSRLWDLSIRISALLFNNLTHFSPFANIKKIKTKQKISKFSVDSMPRDHCVSRKFSELPTVNPHSLSSLVCNSQVRSRERWRFSSRAFSACGGTRFLLIKRKYCSCPP